MSKRKLSIRKRTEDQKRNELPPRAKVLLWLFTKETWQPHPFIATIVALTSSLTFAGIIVGLIMGIISLFPDTEPPPSGPKGDDTGTNGQHRASVMDLTVFSQRSVVSENGRKSNTVVFRIENELKLNVGSTTIEIFPDSGPLPHRDDASFFAHTAECVTTSRWNDAVWQISCDYIGAAGVVGFAVDSDGEDGYPSGTLVISSSEATKLHRF